MSKEELGVLTTSSEYCAYPHVQSVAYHLLKCAQQTEFGSAYTSLASIVFSAFTFEAALNQIGVSKRLPNWDKDDCRKLEEKIAAVSEYCNHPIPKGNGNGQLIHRAFSIRDSYAHAKPKTKENPLIYRIPKAKVADIVDPLIKPTIMPWQECATPTFAELVFNAVQIEASELFRKADIDETKLTMSFEALSFE